MGGEPGRQGHSPSPCPASGPEISKLGKQGAQPAHASSLEEGLMPGLGQEEDKMNPEHFTPESREVLRAMQMCQKDTDQFSTVKSTTNGASDEIMT